MSTREEDCGCGGAKLPPDPQVTSRRDFLRNTAKATAAIALAGAVIGTTAGVQPAEADTNIIRYGLCMHDAGERYGQDNAECGRKPKKDRTACYERATKADQARIKACKKQWLDTAIAA